MPESRPTLIPGYARLLHGGDYNPDQWQAYPEVLEEDYRLMRLAGCNTFAVGIFAWTSLEPEEGRYTFEWLDRVMDRMAAEDHRVILATPSGAKPAWMARRYPEICRVDRQGRREHYQGRHNHCWRSPVYREKVRAINEALARRYGRHPALGMWHLSNEYSGECLCPLCLDAFRDWLRERYQTLESLNHAWWSTFWSHTFTAWEEIDPRDFTLDGLSLDWMRFNTRQVVDFVRWEKAPLRQHAPGIPITTNFMGTFQRLDYAALAAEMDLIADDQYPAYDADDPDLVRRAVGIGFKDDLYRCFLPGRPWMLMECCPDTPQWKKPNRLKRPGLHRAEMLQALGHGAEGTCYFQWRKGRGGHEKFHGAVVDHVGHEHTRVFQTVAQLGQTYAALTPILGSAVRAEVALVYDWEARWGLEFSDGPQTADHAYDRVAHDCYQPFWEMGVPVDVISSERDFSAYRLLVLPQLWMLKPGVAERIARFTAGGGEVVATPYLGFTDSSNLCWRGGWPGDGLQEVFGVWNEENDGLPAGATRRCRPLPADDLTSLPAPAYHARELCSILHLRGARALAVWDEDFYAGTPALTAHRHGGGLAWYLGGRFEMPFLRHFLADRVRRLGLRRNLDVEIPAGVAVQRREASDGRSFLFVQNFSAEARTLALGGAAWVDLEWGAAAGPALELAPFASFVLAAAP